jgi:hypothetical protein
MEQAGGSGDPLGDDFRIFIDQNAHWILLCGDSPCDSELLYP